MSFLIFVLTLLLGSSPNGITTGGPVPAPPPSQPNGVTTGGPIPAPPGP